MPTPAATGTNLTPSAMARIKDHSCSGPQCWQCAGAPWSHGACSEGYGGGSPALGCVGGSTLPKAQLLGGGSGLSEG